MLELNRQPYIRRPAGKIDTGAAIIAEIVPCLSHPKITPFPEQASWP
jgi:hypothetical protein